MMNSSAPRKAGVFFFSTLALISGCYETVEVARPADTAASSNDSETIPDQDPLPPECALVETGSFLGIWGIEDNTIYAVGGYESGDQKNVVQLDDGQWRTLVPKIPLSTATGVWGASRDYVWIVGQATVVGVAVVHDGTNLDLTRAPLIPVGPLWDIWGSGADDVWTVGASTLAHYNGDHWNLAQFNAFPYVFKGIWGSSQSDVYVVGSPAVEFPYLDQSTLVHFDGQKWSKPDIGIEVEAKLLGVSGSGPDNIYVTGHEGTLLHYDGSAWSHVDLGVDVTGYNLQSVWVTKNGSVYVVGNNEVDRSGIIAVFSDGSWRVWDGLSSFAFYDVWASSTQEVYVAGESGVLRCSGL